MTLCRFTKGTLCLCSILACLLLVLAQFIVFQWPGERTTTPLPDSSESVVVAKSGKENETALTPSGGLLFPQGPQTTKIDITEEEKEDLISAIDDSPPVAAPDADGDNDKSSMISFMENERPKNLHIAFSEPALHDTRYVFIFRVRALSILMWCMILRHPPQMRQY
jgi:hypothetical protein